MSFEYIISQLAVVVFAVTAVLAISHKGVDLFGILVLGFITALGGGTIRDLVLGVPVFWTVDLLYVYTSLGGALGAFVFFRIFIHSSSYRLLLYLDGMGAAMFAIQGMSKTWELGIGRPIIPIMMGIISAIGGSIIRDVIAGRVNLLMRRELYANPVLIGCIVYAILLHIEIASHYASIIGMVTIFAGRAAAIHWGLVVPGSLMLKGVTNDTISFSSKSIKPKD